MSKGDERRAESKIRAKGKEEDEIAEEEVNLRDMRRPVRRGKCANIVPERVVKESIRSVEER